MTAHVAPSSAPNELPPPTPEVEAFDRRLDALEAKVRELQARLAALQRAEPRPASCD